MRASSNSWKHQDAPVEREDLGFEAVFTDADAEQLMLGVIPQQMEDKWFIYFADGWLRFHRSWTGAWIYALRLDGSPTGVRIIESWVNRNPQQYTARDTAYDRRLVAFLIDALLLKNPKAKFPMPADSAAAPKGVVRHSIAGRAYPESSSE
jgi:hypothetical protein